MGEARRRHAALICSLVLAAAGTACTSTPDDRTRAGSTEGGIHYELSGRGRPVVLIHGFSLDTRMWQPQLEELTARYRIIRYDLRGHGKSAAIGDPFTAYEDLRAVLDAVGVEAASLVGLSAGSRIALDFALAYPDRVTRLVLAGPDVSGYVPQVSFEWLAPVLEAARAGDASRAAALWAETAMMAIPSRPAGDSLMRQIVRDNARLWSYRVNPERSLTPPAVGRLSDVAVPVLVITGERDLAHIHAVADTLVACIEGARSQVIPDAGHLVNLAAPEAFNRAVVTFLDEADAAVRRNARRPGRRCG